MEIKDTLVEWLRKPPKKAKKIGGDTFPYYSKYDTFKNYLDNYLHNEVTKGAIYQEIKESIDVDKIIWLNDHGPEHIKTVIERASQLLNNGTQCPLAVREVFLLLNAIQVHDVGNFYGRNGHEAKVINAIGEGLTPILFDSTEVIYIKNIAQVLKSTLLLFGIILSSQTSFGQWSTSGNSISAGNFLGTTNSQPLVFKTNNSQVMTILANGNVGIGTIDPHYPLQVVGNVVDSGSLFANYIESANGISVGQFKLVAGIVDSIVSTSGTIEVQILHIMTFKHY